MPLQTGVGLIIAYRKETAYGVLPANDASAKQLRRVSFGLSLKKDLIKSEEIRRDYQRPAGRHGMRKVDGSIVGELSPGSYADFVGSALRRLYATVTTLGALINVTATVGAPQFVRGTGSWITDGLRVGMIVRMTGWTTTGTGNNTKNFTIIALTATGMTVGEAVAAKAAGDSIVVSIPGKVTFAPLTAHTDESYALESWASAVPQSLRFLGNKVGSIDIDLPPNDKASITIGFMGQDRAKSTTQYFTAAVAAGTSTMLTGLTGLIYIAGVSVGVLTAFKIMVNGDPEVQGVVGSNITPDVFQGPIDVSGSFSVLWNAATFDDYFDLETEVSVVVKLVDGTAAAADFITITMPFIKMAGGDQPDAPKAIVQSFEFAARVGDGTSGFEATTIQIQDSLA